MNLSSVNLVFNAGVKTDNNHIIAVAANFNGLFMIDPLSGESKYLGSFPKENPFGMILFFEGCIAGNRVFWSPQNAKHIGVYDLVTGEISSLSIPRRDGEECKCSDIKMFDGKVYLISTDAKVLIEIDPVNYEMKTHLSTYDSNVYCRRACLHDHHLYTTSVHGNELIDWNLETKKCIINHLGEGFRGSYSICFEHERLWIPPRYMGDSLIVWDLSSKSSENIKIDECLVSDKKTYLYCFYDGDFINIIAELNTESVAIDPNTGEIVSRNFNLRNDNSRKTGVYMVTDDEIFLCNLNRNKSYYWNNSGYVRYDIANGNMREDLRFTIRKNEESYDKLEYYLLKGMKTERKGVGIKNLLSLIGEFG